MSTLELAKTVLLKSREQEEDGERIGLVHSPKSCSMVIELATVVP